MKKHMTIDVFLTVMGPFLCTAKGTSRWGVDAFFNKNEKGNCIIMSSHVKGKLREAWKELQSASGNPTEAQIQNWLGQENAEGKYFPEKGILVFSDFLCADPHLPDEQQYQRIRIETESGTADEGALLTYETPFASGRESKWKGTIEFSCEDQEIDTIKKQLALGLRWITALGANKGIGFGRLMKVELKEESRDVKITLPSAQARQESVIGLKIMATEPLLIGGIKRKAFYLESESVISGAALKGSLASCINRRLGLSPNQELPKDLPELPNLSKHFENLRFTHAFPTINCSKLLRPVMVPLSTVKAKDRYYDLSSHGGPRLMGKNELPEFQIDWKSRGEIDSHFGMACPRGIARTRTAIEGESRRAKEEQLYTYLYICPEDNEEKPVCWVSNITFPNTLSEKENTELVSELSYVIKEWWQYLGKRSSKIQVDIQPGGFDPSMDETGLLIQYTAVITLQSDTVMIDPMNARENSDIYQLYKTYWQEVSHNSLELKAGGFFASQKMVGGYPVHRFKKQNYYPLYLTNAGSVFVLTTTENTKKAAEEKLKSWKQNGLPFAKWALDQYGSSQRRPDWRCCPFVPENGFGEITVNMRWHQKAKDGIQL